MQAHKSFLVIAPFTLSLSQKQVPKFLIKSVLRGSQRNLFLLWYKPLFLLVPGEQAEDAPFTADQACLLLTSPMEKKWSSS